MNNVDFFFYTGSSFKGENRPRPDQPEHAGADLRRENQSAKSNALCNKE
jgi:hypothetical protein